MKAYVSDVHDGHGLVFTLTLEKDGDTSDKVIEFLNKNLKPLISGKCQNESTLYVHHIELGPNTVKLNLVEQTKVRAEVDYRSSSRSQDGKFLVLVIETCEEGVPGKCDN